MKKSCPVCTRDVEFFEKYPSINSRWFLCPSCKSKERDRFAGLLLNKIEYIKNGGRILHVAPEECLHSFFIKKYNPVKYLSIDVNPKIAMQFGDIQQLSFPDESFDFIYCSHVLSTVNNDKLALNEMYRILASDGIILSTEGIRYDSKYTLCEPSVNTPEDRYNAYGSRMAKRYYGEIDYINLLKECKFKVEMFSPADILTNQEECTYCTKSTDRFFILKK